MSKIEQMIKEMCPDGVELKMLGEVCEIKRGVRITKMQLFETGYPVVSGGAGYMGYTDSYNRDGSMITIAQYGTAGYINWQTEKFWANDVCFCVYPNKNVLNKYLYYFLKNKQEYIYSISNRTAIPYSISKDVLMKVKIFVPPIEVQEEIVKTLDKFTDYATELQAELQFRTKQYEYYRNLLLSEDYINKIDSKKLLRKTTLGEIGVFTKGNGVLKKDFVESGKPIIHYGEIYTKYGFEVNKNISFVDKELFAKLKKAQCNDILIASASENKEDLGKAIVWTGLEEIGFSVHMYSYRTKENPKYIAYYFQTNSFQKQKNKKITGTKVFYINGSDMEKFSILLPPIEIQNKVVQVLDKFQALAMETKGLLPKEIERRKKQYEYYREKLLTFSVECDSKQ